jgi:hypothetical protein
MDLAGVAAEYSLWPAVKRQIDLKSPPHVSHGPAQNDSPLSALHIDHMKSVVGSKLPDGGDVLGLSPKPPSELGWS